MQVNIFILLLSILSLSVQAQEKPEQKQKDEILFIYFNENTKCVNIDTNNNIIYPDDINCIGILDMVDDFSEYFPTKNVFYFDGTIEMTGTEAILLWDYDVKKTYSKFPVEYSHLKIDSISKDTVLYFKVNNVKHKILPDESFTDSIISFETEGRYIRKYTSIITIKNFGLLPKSNIIDNTTWNVEKYRLGLDAPLKVEQMPEFPDGHQEIIKYFTSNISIDSIDKTKNTFAVFEFIIDENGEVSMARILRSINKDIDKQIMLLIKNMPKWKPGKNKGKTVPVKIILPIKLNFE